VAETDIEPLPPAASTLTLLGLSEIRGSADACWLMLNVWPMPPSGVTVMVAVRVLFVVLAEALHCTEPDPIPVAPDEIDSQVASLLTAVHCKKGSSVKTDIVPLSLLWPALADDGLMLKAPPN
jgi:hypothetical protein